MRVSTVDAASPPTTALARGMFALEFNTMTQELAAARGRLAGFNDELAREVKERTDELRRLNAGLARVDKLASMGQVAAAVMHELGNPLAAIKTRVQLELEQVHQGTYRATLLAVLDEVDRLTRFLRTFGRLGRAAEPRVTVLSLAEVLQSVETLLGPSQASLQVAVRFELEPGLRAVAGDSDQLRQLLLNLVLNAIEASAGGQVVTVRACANAGAVELEVEDRGRGMPPEVLARAGEPFFTTRRVAPAWASRSAARSRRTMGRPSRCPASRARARQCG